MATASTIIKTASNEIGVKETGNNNVKYNTERPWLDGGWCYWAYDTI